MANTMLPSGISVRIREDLIDGAARVQTTLIVDPIITAGGHRVTMADIGSIGYGKIDGGTSREEIVSWTGITDNTNTYTLTGCVWGINFHNLSNDVDNTKRHTSGAKFEIKTDMHYITNQFRDNLDNTFTSTDDMDFTADNIKLGDGTTASDKILYAQNGDANEPFVSYDESEDKWLISNNGVDTFDITAGGSGLTAGDSIAINASAIDLLYDTDLGLDIGASGVFIDLATDPGLQFTSGDLDLKLDPVGGLSKTSAGLAATSIKFGGDGSDGALSVASGTTTLDAAGANVLIKNYTSIDIASGATLTIENPASNGTLLILKCQGNCTIAGTIDMSGMGADPLTNGFEIFDEDNHYGSNGSNGATTTTNSEAAGGAGGTGGATYSVNKFYITKSVDRLYRKFIVLACGTGGASGGVGGEGKTPAGGTVGASGAGGTGGGGLLIECGLALDFSGDIDISGNDGSNGGDGISPTGGGGTGGGGGGAGGSAGMALVLYKSLTANTGTVDASGGAGGDGGDGSAGTGGDGGEAGGGGGAGSAASSGSYETTGKNGVTGGDGGSSSFGGDNGVNGTAGTLASGGSGGSGGGGGGYSSSTSRPGGTGGTGGAAGTSDPDHYLITENTAF